MEKPCSVTRPTAAQTCQTVRPRQGPHLSPRVLGVRRYLIQLSREICRHYTYLVFRIIFLRPPNVVSAFSIGDQCHGRSRSLPQRERGRKGIYQSISNGRVTNSRRLITARQSPRCFETHHRVCVRRPDRRLLTSRHRLLTSKHEDSVRLYCTVPTWSPSSEICMDSLPASPYDWGLLTRICQVSIFMTSTPCDLDLCTLSTT